MDGLLAIGGGNFNDRDSPTAGSGLPRNRHGVLGRHVEWLMMNGSRTLPQTRPPYQAPLLRFEALSMKQGLMSLAAGCNRKSQR